MVTAQTGASAAPTSAQKCESAKLTAQSRFAACRLRADAAYAKTLDAVRRATRYVGCATALGGAYTKLEAKYPGVCPTVGDEMSAEDFLEACTATAMVATHGAGWPVCGNGWIDVAGEQCDGADLGGTTCASLGFASGTLGCDGSCEFDTSGCAPASSQAFPATGQTTCWDSSGIVISCTGTGQDGDVQAGATLAYTDNGDGTITDNNTGLMWEKLDDNNTGGIHDKDNTYTWDDAFAVKIATLNSTSFAGHTDWRLPNSKELYSIVNLQNVSPAVSVAFNMACAGGCTATGTPCSCTVPFVHWSSSTYAGLPDNAWVVNFNVGDPHAFNKSFSPYVRAVRGGS